MYGFSGDSHTAVTTPDPNGHTKAHHDPYDAPNATANANSYT